MKKITIKEAIEQGYKNASDETGEFNVSLKELQENPDMLESQKLFLGSKETFRFSISEKAIEQMIEEYITNQDEVNDENEQLYDQMDNIDFKAIADLINPHFTTNYHSVTDIELIP